MLTHLPDVVCGKPRKWMHATPGSAIVINEASIMDIGVTETSRARTKRARCDLINRPRDNTRKINK